MNVPDIASTIRSIESFNERGLFTAEIVALKNADFRMKSGLWRLSPMDSFNESITTIHNTIYLPLDYDSWMNAEKSAVMVHEGVHLIQYQKNRLTVTKYLLDARHRFTMEIEAETKETYFRVALGNLTKSKIPDYCSRMVERWPDEHRCRHLKTNQEWFNLFRGICEEAFRANGKPIR